MDFPAGGSASTRAGASVAATGLVASSEGGRGGRADREGGPGWRLLLGHAGSDPQAPGVISTRVGYTRRRRAQRDLSQPRHPRRGDRDRLRPGADELPRDPRILLPDPRSDDQNRQGNDMGRELSLGDLLRSTTSRRRSPRTRSPTSRPRACGPARSSPRSRPPGRSGRPSPSTRIISSAIPTAIPATSRGPAGCSRRGARSTYPRESVLAPSASRDETGALLGQTMGLVALTAGLFALGAYLGRHLATTWQLGVVHRRLVLPARHQPRGATLRAARCLPAVRLRRAARPCRPDDHATTPALTRRRLGGRRCHPLFVAGFGAAADDAPRPFSACAHPLLGSRRG